MAYNFELTNYRSFNNSPLVSTLSSAYTPDYHTLPLLFLCARHSAKALQVPTVLDSAESKTS